MQERIIGETKMGFERVEKIINDQYDRKMAELQQNKENVQAATTITYDLLQASKRGGIKVESLYWGVIFLVIPGVVNIYIQPFEYKVSCDYGKYDLYTLEDLERILEQALDVEK